MDGKWDLIIKVKHGDTMKRFNVNVDNWCLHQNITELRTNIIRAFKLAENSVFVLTYTDEDGDAVILDDDNDLHDAAIRQKLNPLRVNLEFKANDTVVPKEPDARSSKEGPHTGSSSMGNSFSQINSFVDEALRFLPEPHQSSLSNLLNVVLSGAASAAPQFAGELFENLSKFGADKCTAPSPSAPREGSSSGGKSKNRRNDQDLPTAEKCTATSADVQRDGSSVPNCPFPTSDVQDAQPQVPSQDPQAKKLEKEVCSETTNTFIKGKSVMPDHTAFVPARQSSGNVKISEASKKRTDSVYRCPGMRHCGSNSKQPPSGASPFTGLFRQYQNPDAWHPGSSLPIHFGITCDGCEMSPITGARYKSNVRVNYDLCGNCFSARGNDAEYTKIERPGCVDGNSGGTFPTFHRGVACDICGMSPIFGPRYRSNVKPNYDLCGVCYSLRPNTADYTRIDSPAFPCRGWRDLSMQLRPPFPPHYPNLHPTPLHLHQQRRPKFESRFIQDVTIADGTVVQPSTSFTKIWRMRNNGSFPWPLGTKLVWIGGDKFAVHNAVQLEIPFSGIPIEGEIDIAVDLFAPSNPGRYTSYWRLALPSGQKFGQRVWVLIQVDLPIYSDQSLNCETNSNLEGGSKAKSWGVKLDFDINREPDADDDGDELVKQSTMENKNAYNEHPSSKLPEELLPKGFPSAPCPAIIPPPSPHTLPPIIDLPPSSSNGLHAPDMVPTKKAMYPLLPDFLSLDDILPQDYLVDDLISDASPFSIVSQAAPADTEMLNPTADSPLSMSSASSTVVQSVDVVGADPVMPLPDASTNLPPLFSNTPATAMPSLIEVGSADATPVITLDTANPPVSSLPAVSGAADDKNVMEERLLNELKQMGFKQTALNKEIISLANYDLEQSVEILCGYSDWDPLLDELKELGFADEEKNSMALLKNNGSIKRAVMDLVAAEKTE